MKWQEAGENCVMKSSFIIYTLQKKNLDYKMIKSKRMRLAEHVISTGRMRIAYKMLVGNPEAKREIGRSRRRLEDNIKMNKKEIGWEVVD
jgi:hypothetical protein